MVEDRVYLKEGGARYLADAGADVADAEGAIRVPVMEERLDVAKRQVEQGEVTIHKSVEQEQVRSRWTCAARRSASRSATPRTGVDPTTAELAFKEGTIRVPVRGEEAVVAKQAYQTGEVTIDKEQKVERQEVADTVRRERVEVDEDRQTTRADKQPPTATARAAQADSAGDGAWEELKDDVREASDRTRGQ